jgi:hypothetical protein
MMIRMHCYTESFAAGMALHTAEEMLVEAEKKVLPRRLKPEDMLRMRKEVEGLEISSKRIEANHHQNVMRLTFYRPYLKRLLANGRVVKYLSRHHAEILAEFQAIIAE